MTHDDHDSGYDVAVVGAGIVGLAHAWMAARRGYRVALFERSSWAHGASIRNFGMIWPVGQPAGHPIETAIRSRELWLEMATASGIWADQCGSIHLAHRPDELAVLEEFCAFAASTAHSVRMLTRNEVLERSSAPNPDGLLGGMWSDTELCVNPRQAVSGIPKWLNESLGVALHFDTLIVSAGEGRLAASDGRMWQADRVVICSGSDFQTLFPTVFADSGLKQCKLQMMKTGPQPDAFRIGPHLASGLTLRHYTSFRDCASLAALCDRIAEETPELNQFGIHVMASQNREGEVILGDSHEYDADVAPFDSSEIESLMLRELRRILVLPDWKLSERWHGIYAKHPDRLIFEAEPLPGVHIAVGPGGAGMTMSFGLADNRWSEWHGQ